MTKFIFVTGGVLSSLGKGIAGASLASLLEMRGHTVALMKMDPYLNVDPGTMSPFQHGEVFVTEDGAETDLDLGHYERFTGFIPLRRHTITTGQVYNAVLENERRGDYLGQTVQVVPHVTNEIKKRIHKAAGDADVLIVEIGGTVGDIEGQPFLEAIRQMRNEHRHNVLNIHLTYVPYIKAAGEMKTKPTQHSVKELQSLGIQPDVILCRTEHNLSDDLRKKIAMFCSVDEESVFACVDAESIYQVPGLLHKEGFDARVSNLLGLMPMESTRSKEISNSIQTISNFKYNRPVRIAIVGKYVEHKDAYKSINEALIHAGWANEVHPQIHWIEAEKLYNDSYTAQRLEDLDAILIPGGFGDRGIEGMMRAIRYGRENDIPVLGICLGMQLMSIESARNKTGDDMWNSEEFRPASDRLLFVPITRLVTNLGGTMRLGAYDCQIKKDTLAHEIYGREFISERHRHRYEMDEEEALEHDALDLIISGRNPGTGLVEIVEMDQRDHRFFIGVQFHPEFKSKPASPSPIFDAFIKAAKEYRYEVAQ